jgi:hypothetical protein
MVMVQLGVPIGEALARIRAYAYAHGRRLGEVAGDVSDRRLHDRDMHMLTERVVELTDATAAGMLLADQRGRLEFVAGSDENVKLV